MKVVNIRLDNQITLNKRELSEGILDQIRIFLTLDNPAYINAEIHRKNKKGEFFTNIPRYIFAFSEDDDNFYTFRGYIGCLIPFLQQNGFQYRIVDNRRKLSEIDLHFKGDLRNYQDKAIFEMLKKYFGVLVAPCGSGKTIMACSIIAERKQPTFVIVHTKELMNQWVERIKQYLGILEIDVGIIGAGKEIIKPVTVGMVQTLYKRNLNEIKKYFGQIIVDECHHIPSRTFIDVVSAFDSLFMLGLSATPYRRDKLTKLIFSSLGNLTATVKDCELQQAGVKIKPEIVVRQTSFNFNYQEDSDYQPMISALTADDIRNRLIVSDVIQEARSNGNSILILSDRKSHLWDLESLLREQGIKVGVLTRETRKIDRETIIHDFESGVLRVVLATGQLAGEGLDIPRLNRLFIACPIKWKGKVLQYAGRALRTAEGKTDARIYDYVDKVGVLINAFRVRRRVYRSLN